MQPVSHQIYFREFDAAGNDSLSKLAARIAPRTKVLDVGCGPGVLGAQLTAVGCVVDGIEGSASAAELAATKLRRVVVADLEREPVASHVGDERYDYIVCADVLEHLRRPEALLAQLGALLTPGGRILLSVPNVAYAGLVGALINGDFRYRPDGLLDVTHLRFFTRRSLEALVADCGLAIVHTDAVTMPINESEFAGDGVEALPPIVLRTLLAQPDALTYQLLFEVVPAAIDAGERTAVDGTRTAFSFLAQLHHRTDDDFDADHVSTVHGAMGVERQTLRFALPPSPSGFSGLRLDPANRPGYLRLFGLALVNESGEAVWRWQPHERLDRAQTNQLHVVPEPDAALLVLGGDDPWLELPIPETALRTLRGGGALEIDLTWPQSADSFAVLRRLFGTAPDGQRESEIVRLGDEARALRAEVAELRGQLHAEREELNILRNSLTMRMTRPFHRILRRWRGR